MYRTNDATYKKILTPYLENVYDMHNAGTTQDSAYDNPNKELYYKTFNEIAEYAKSNPTFAKGATSSRFSWKNLLRKIIDIVLDEIGVK